MLALATSHANDPSAPRAVTVSFADLNLEQSAGAAALLARINGAAHIVCGETYVRDARVRARRDACISQAVDRAVKNVNHPRLTALHQARGNRASPTVALASATAH